MKRKITETKQQVNELTEAKSKLLIELGQEVYLAYRRGEDIESVVANKGSSIKDLDSKIYSLLQETKLNRENVMECSCGAPLSEEDVFCPECGKKTDMPDSREQNQMTMCYVCENEVPAEADYCQACGAKMKKVYAN
ncbi:zinc ribbon domain-containing protein [Lentibacillus sp. CBA3610]|uniref:zinc ribbon domain-containing protein n=1 Tax=Lentibacillus sp. CBA3610 TaxID=2518176 RepID=UPI0015950BC8|nr:zinc ribbon domain-containing protein [Lentibacillus sp. CBA3610]QKY69960.1 zinc ribbon domain-containing protein [Lentibacillus sp. CBA3610]